VKPNPVFCLGKGWMDGEPTWSSVGMNVPLDH
jgi:hypothetical protein